MKIVVLGATGGIGMEILRQATECHHEVTAFVRDPERLKALRAGVNVIHGNLLSAAELETAIQNHDGVLSAFGPRLPISKADSHLLSQFSDALTTAMLCTTVRRVVVVSSAFLFKDSLIPPTHLVGRLFFPDVVVDAAGMENVLANSGLDWTIVRPPRLNDKPHTGQYRVRDGHLPRFGFAISRANVADFMIKTMETSASIHKIVGVAN